VSSSSLAPPKVAPVQCAYIEDLNGFVVFRLLDAVELRLKFSPELPVNGSGSSAPHRVTVSFDVRSVTGPSAGATGAATSSATP